MKRLFLSLALALGIFAIPLPSFATVSSTTNTVQYSGDGHSTSFSFNNNVYLASDLNVYEVTAGVSTLLTLNTNYSVSLTAISGVTGAYTATINLAGGSSPAGALAVGTTLVITRNIPYTQLINISDYSATPAATWNQAHDRGVILSQQLLNLVNRSILQSITASTPITFPSAVASNIIGWNAAGTGLTNYVPNSSTYISLPLAASQGGTGSASITFPLSTANGGTGSTANANTANGPVVLNSSGNFPAINGSLLTNVISGGTKTTFSSQPSVSVALATGNVYKVVILATQNTSNCNPLAIQFNSDSTSGHYQWVGTFNYVGNATVTPAGSGSTTLINVAQPQSNSQFMISMDVSTITNGAYNASIISNASYLLSNNWTQFMVSGLYTSTTVTSMQITPSAGTISGTIYVYQLS